MLKLSLAEMQADDSEDWEAMMWTIVASQGYEIHQFMNYLGGSEPYLETLVEGQTLVADEFGPHCSFTQGCFIFLPVELTVLGELNRVVAEACQYQANCIDYKGGGCRRQPPWYIVHWHALVFPVAGQAQQTSS